MSYPASVRKAYWAAKCDNTRREYEIQLLLAAGVKLKEAVAIVDQK